MVNNIMQMPGSQLYNASVYSIVGSPPEAWLPPVTVDLTFTFPVLSLPLG